MTDIFEKLNTVDLNDLFEEKKINVEKDIKISGLEKMEDNAFSRYVEKSAKLISKLDEVGMPKNGQQIRLVTRRSFNAIHFIEYVTQSEIIENIKIAIYSINFNAAKILINLIDQKKILKAEILMSNLRNSAYREKEVLVKNMLVERENVKLFFCSSHAKVFSCKTNKGNFYTVEGSGNLGYNSRIEQYVIDNDRLLYDFTCSWFEEIKQFLKDKRELVLT